LTKESYKHNSYFAYGSYRTLLISCIEKHRVNKSAQDGTAIACVKVAVLKVSSRSASALQNLQGKGATFISVTNSASLSEIHCSNSMNCVTLEYRDMKEYLNTYNKENTQKHRLCIFLCFTRKARRMESIQP